MSIVKEFNLLLRGTRGSATLSPVCYGLASQASERRCANQRRKLRT